MDLAPISSHREVLLLREHIADLQREVRICMERLSVMEENSRKRRITVIEGKEHIPGHEEDWIQREVDATNASIQKTQEMYARLGVTGSVEFARRQAGPYAMYQSPQEDSQ